MRAVFRAVGLAVMVAGASCATEPANEPRAPIGSDRYLCVPTEIRADEIEIVLPRWYRGACSVVCDPDAQERRITQTSIELADPVGLGIPPLTLQVRELRLLAKQSLRATFDDEAAKRNKQLVKLVARGHVRYRSVDGSKEASQLSIRNADLELKP